MESIHLFSHMQETLNLMDRMRNHFKLMEDSMQKNILIIQKYQEEILTVQSQLQKISSSNTTIQEPKSACSSSNKENEPMSVKDAIDFLKKSKVHLSGYGYYLCGSFEVRYAALKKAMQTYPIEKILQKLRALIIVWSQNTADRIKSAEEYLNHLCVDFHTLKEESLKPKLA